VEGSVMENERFDEVIRSLGAGISRRGALELLAGIAGLGLSEAAAKNRKRRQRKSTGRVQAEKAGKPQKADKVTVCHATSSETNPYEVITISENGWLNGHSGHEGDSLRGNCCVDDDCDEPDDRCFVSECQVVGEGTKRKSKCVEVLREECNCTEWILSGGEDPTALIHVDDDLRVDLNGDTIFDDQDNFADDHPPIAFAAAVGDELHVVATDKQTPCRSLSPLWLHCPASGLSRQLFAGVNDGCAGNAVPFDFVNETFTVEL
jgi:hypothetical protein